MLPRGQLLNREQKSYSMSRQSEVPPLSESEWDPGRGKHISSLSHVSGRVLLAVASGQWIGGAGARDRAAVTSPRDTSSLAGRSQPRAGLGLLSRPDFTMDGS